MFYFLTHMFLLATMSLLASEEGGTCSLCERIREKNAKNPGPQYKYYEDYLKEHEEDSQQSQQKTDVSEQQGKETKK